MFISKDNSNRFGREFGSIWIYRDKSCSLCLGTLEYEITRESKKLHISNLISYDSGSGIGSRLMKEVQNIARKQTLSIEFEVGRGSAGFYKKWLKRTFNLKPKGGVKTDKVDSSVSMNY